MMATLPGNLFLMPSHRLGRVPNALMEWFCMVSSPANLFLYFETCLISERCLQLAFFNLTEATNYKLFKFSNIVGNKRLP
jgi:hypothetical protein